MKPEIKLSGQNLLQLCVYKLQIHQVIPHVLQVVLAKRKKKLENNRYKHLSAIISSLKSSFTVNLAHKQHQEQKLSTYV